MIFCQKCKNELPEDARFCNVCGSSQILTAPLSDTPTPTNQEEARTEPDIANSAPDSSQLSPSISQNPTRTIQPSIKYIPSHRNVGERLIHPISPLPPARPTQFRSPQTAGATELSASSPPRPPGLIQRINMTSSTRPANADPMKLIEAGNATPVHPQQLPATPAPLPPPLTPQPQQAVRPTYASLQTSMQNRQQLTEQETKKQPGQPPQQVRSEKVVGHQPDQIVPTSTNWPWPTSSNANVPANKVAGTALKEQNDIARTGARPFYNPGFESVAATSKAAERWRKSWRDRQRAEAGPAEGVSRGHASVPMPLMAMQQSIARMRAIVNANKQDGSNSNFSFWVTLLLMICLIGGLGAYVISTYLPNSPFGAEHIVPPSGAAQPSLTIQGTPPQSVVAGEILHLHGEHFEANASISFLLDTITPIVNTNGKNISVQADNQGAFEVALPIGSDWSTGSHLIQAVDRHTNQNAYLNILVSPSGTPVKSSKELALTFQGQAVSQLSFTGVVGQRNPDKSITLTNTGSAPLTWSATATADNNLSWLIITNNQTSGKLDINGTNTINISANMVGLKSSKKPYTGNILFTINNTEQLTLPIQLQVLEAPAEMVFSPTPIVAHVGHGGSCLPGTTLTLINLGNEVITWNVNPDVNIAYHIQFAVNGKLTNQGVLNPAGRVGDSQILTLGCTAVKAGDRYHVTIVGNSIQWSEFVVIES